MRKFLLAAAGVAALASATAMAEASPNTPGNTGVGDKINSSAFSAKEGAMAANPPPTTPAKAAQAVPK